jgi:hypothetical protein
MPDEASTETSAQLKYEHADNFISAYANNFYLESSAWDLKIIFGQLDQSSTPNVIKQNVAITLPWAQAKLLLYYLRIHVAAEEVADGKIHIRPDLIPPEVSPPTPEQANDPKLESLFEIVKKLREEFIASLQIP